MEKTIEINWASVVMRVLDLAEHNQIAFFYVMLAVFSCLAVTIFVIKKMDNFFITYLRIRYVGEKKASKKKKKKKKGK